MLRFNVRSGRPIAALGIAAALAFAEAGALARGVSAERPAARAAKKRETAEEVIQAWPKDARAMAMVLIERYGKPRRFDDDRLVWIDNGPWRRTVLHRDGLTRSAVLANRDHLAQSAAYQVPKNKIAELRDFDKRIKVDRTAGEISSRADDEKLNFLALNLADDIIQGRRTALGARLYYQKARIFEIAGKSSPYLETLRFVPARRKR